MIAGGTAGVLDEAGRTIERLTASERGAADTAGTANKGMVAKLNACRAALKRGVGDVVIAERTRGAVRFAGSREACAGRLHTGGAMKFTLDDIRARESRHVLQTYKRQAVAFVRGRGARLYDADGREYLDLVSGIGVASLGHAHPGLGGGDCRTGRHAAPHVEPLLPPVPGRSRRAPGEALRAAAGVLLQQRHRGQRSVSEVRAPILAHQGR